MRNHSLTKKIAAVGMFTVLGIAAVGSAVTFAAGTGTVAAASEMPEKPEHDGKYMGKITAIDSSSITIETMGGPMGHGGQKPDGNSMTPPEAPTNADGTAMTPPERPANDDGTTPPELPTNADGTAMTPPEMPTNADGTAMTPPEGMNGKGEMGKGQSMTFTTTSSYTSEFSVGDMVEIQSEDGETADSVSEAKRPEKKENTES